MWVETYYKDMYTVLWGLIINVFKSLLCDKHILIFSFNCDFVQNVFPAPRRRPFQNQSLENVYDTPSGNITMTAFPVCKKTTLTQKWCTIETKLPLIINRKLLSPFRVHSFFCLSSYLTFYHVLSVSYAACIYVLTALDSLEILSN